jgi:hypothetical protein
MALQTSGRSSHTRVTHDIQMCDLEHCVHMRTRLYQLHEKYDLCEGESSHEF